MNLLSSFSDFYDNLSSDGEFFFWIIVFLFCFLVFLSIILVIKNKKLTKLLKEESDIINSNNEVPVISPIAKKELLEIKQNIKLEEEKPTKEEIKEIKKEDIKDEKGPYKKNVLKEMNARNQTSPINIVRENEHYNHNIDYSDNYGFEESYLREESISPLEDMEDTYEVNDNMKFASEIVEKMEEEIKPSNIELTDYEKKQEEEAIISYDELLKVKDKIYNITEDEETDEFIDELKSFRLDL